MEVVAAGDEVQREAIAASVGGTDAQMVQPLRIAVPAVGVHFAFEKLYANQSDEDASFSIRYGGIWPATALIVLLLGALGYGGWHWVRRRKLSGRVAPVVETSSPSEPRTDE